MKSSLFLFVFFLIVPAWLVEAQETFIKTYGGDSAQCAHGLGLANDGRVVIASRSSFNGGKAEGTFLTLNPQGALIQSRRVAANDDLFLSGVFPDFQHGTSTLIGSFRTSRGDLDGVILRVRSSGPTLWQKFLGTSNDETFKSFTATLPPGFAVFGETAGSNSAHDFFLAKYNNRGRLQWIRTFGTPGEDIAVHVSHTSDGGFILAGESHDSNLNSPSRAVVIKMDGAGNIQWSRRYASVARNNQGQFVLQTFDLGFYFVQFVTNSNRKGKTLVTKLDVNGNAVWSRLFKSGTANLQLFDGAVGTDGGLVLSGFVRNASGSRGVIVKLDAAGSVVWKKAVKATNRSSALTAGILEAADGTFLTAGCFGIDPQEEPKEGVAVRVNSSGTTGGSCSTLVNVRISSSGFNLTNESFELVLSNPPYQTGNPHLSNTPVQIQSADLCD